MIEVGYYVINRDYVVVKAWPPMSVGTVLWGRHPLAHETFGPPLEEAWQKQEMHQCVFWLGRLYAYRTTVDGDEMRVEYRVLEQLDVTNLRTLSETFDRIVQAVAERVVRTPLTLVAEA